MSLSIQRNGLSTIGLDTNWSALKRFREQSRQAAISLGDALCMPFADESIDCVIAVHCFDHLNRAQFLQECYRVLCGSGLLIFEALNRNSYKWALKKFLLISRKVPPSYSREKWIKIWSCREVLDAVNDCTFDIQAAYGYNWLPFTQGSNSRFIKPAAFIEQALHLDRFFMISPRFLVVAKKRDFQSRLWLTELENSNG